MLKQLKFVSKILLGFVILLTIFSSCVPIKKQVYFQAAEDTLKPEYTNKYLITKEGPFLQYVLIQQRQLDKAFKFTGKKIKSGMLPQEAAAIIIDELASDRNLNNFSIIENAPAVIDGHDGFKILFTYKDKKGSKFKTLYYGFVSDDSFYNLRYCAAMRHYFERDIAAFEQIIGSFKLVNAKNG